MYYPPLSVLWLLKILNNLGREGTGVFIVNHVAELNLSMSRAEIERAVGERSESRNQVVNMLSIFKKPSIK